MIRQTHTYAILELSKAAVDEISEKLREAGYDHAFHDGVVDMHGIAVSYEPKEHSWKEIYRGGGVAVKQCETCGIQRLGDLWRKPIIYGIESTSPDWSNEPFPSCKGSP